MPMLELHISNSACFTASCSPIYLLARTLPARVLASCKEARHEVTTCHYTDPWKAVLTTAKKKEKLLEKLLEKESKLL